MKTNKEKMYTTEFKHFKEKAGNVIDNAHPASFSCCFEVDNTGHLALVFGGTIPSAELIGMIFNEVKQGVLDTIEGTKYDSRQSAQKPEGEGELPN